MITSAGPAKVRAVRRRAMLVLGVLMVLGWLWLGGCSTAPVMVRGDEVAVAVRYVAPGEEVQLRDVRWVRLPPDYVSSDGVRPTSPLVGARVLEPLLPDEPIRSERLEGGLPRSPAGEAVMVEDASIEDNVMVIIAARDLPAGWTVTEDDLSALQIPAQYLPNHVFRSPDHVVGRVVCSRTLANEMFRSERLQDPTGSPACEAQPPG